MKHRRYRYKKKRSLVARKKKSLFRSRLFWLGIAVVLVLGFVGYGIVFSSVFQIREIQVVGSKKIPPEDLKDIVQNVIHHQIVFWESQSIFLADVASIRERITQELVHIATVSATRKFPNSIIVQVQERKSVGIWCEGEKCFHIDREGIAFEQGEANQEKVLVVSEGTPKNISLGDQVLEKQHLRSILEIAGEFERNLEISIERFLVPAEMDKLTVRTTEGWEVYFDLQGDVTDQIFNFGLVLKEQIQEEGTKNLEYVDVRFGNRVYYKYRDQ